MTSVIRTTTRSIRTAEAIRDREDFRTNTRSFYGEGTGRLSAWDSGRLSGDDLMQFRLDMTFIDYVVWSYVTPIAWHWTNEKAGTSGWHVVAQTFSSTTTKHQSNLYLIPRTERVGA